MGEFFCVKWRHRRIKFDIVSRNWLRVSRKYERTDVSEYDPARPGEGSNRPSSAPFSLLGHAPSANPGLFFSGGSAISQTQKLQPEDLIPTRYSLLSRLQNWDDHESWKVFFDTYWRLIFSFAMKSGLTAAEAEDVVQETIISVAKNIQKFKRDRRLGSFKGWLRNLTRWRIADQLRKRTPGSAPETQLDDACHVDMSEIPDFAAAESVWESEWRVNLLKVAMENVKQRVKEEHFQIFDLYALRQWPVNKVAETLGVSVPGVYLAKHRVAAMIKREIMALTKGQS